MMMNGSGAGRRVAAAMVSLLTVNAASAAPSFAAPALADVARADTTQATTPALTGLRAHTNGKRNGRGVDVNNSGGGGKGNRPRRGGRTVDPAYRYAMAPACPDSWVGHERYCTDGYLVCAHLGPKAGPLTNVWRRRTQPSLGPWVIFATTCTPNGRPTLTPTVVRASWAHIPFAKAKVTLQPPDGETLVTLPNYAQVAWPAAGLKPNEITTVRLLGATVRVRATLKSYHFVFGDGTVVATTSSGGTWPNGAISHAYDKPGTYRVRIDTHYGGEFSVGSGGWIPIDGTVVVPGAAVPLTVRTAQGRLVG